MILLQMTLATVHAAERVAVVIGSNSPSPGAARLRYADEDARDIAATLVDVAHFDPAAVHVLIEPDPDAVMTALRSAVLEAEDVVLFYYSGHADPGAIYPGGTALPLQQVRQALLDSDVKLRVGIVDACSGGSWTRTKGMTTDPIPFELPEVTDSEGTAWIASTSGAEVAHEAEVVGGSLFTHHLVVGLRGAADHSGEGAVSLWEAFDYAKRNTTRDAALYASAPQTPSFDLQFRGRRDLVLSEIDGAPSELKVSQVDGPLQVVQVATGVVLLEMERGERTVRLALPPGVYVIRSPQVGRSVRSAEVLLRAGEVIAVGEVDLELHGVPALATKGAGAIDLNALTLPAGRGDIRLRTPVRLTGAPFEGVALDASWAASDRVELSLPGSLAYRGGDRDTTDWVAYGGAIDLAQYYDTLAGRVQIWVHTGLGVDVLHRVGRRSQVQAGLFASRTLEFPPAMDGSRPSPLAFGGQIIWTYTVRERVTFNVGVNVTGTLRDDGDILQLSNSLGFPVTRAGHRVPLVQWRATPNIAFDLFPSDRWIAPLAWYAPIDALIRGPSSPTPLLFGTTITL